jgi:hypothetical protein
MKYDFTFEDLENDPFQKKLIEIIERKYGRPLSDEIKSFLIDNAGNAQLRVDQRVSWVKTTLAITHNIIDGVASTAEYPLFWIRLWGIVREFEPYLQNTREIGELSKWIRTQLEAMDKLMATLSNDDLILIDFMRHNHSHMHVDYVNYHAKAKNNGTLKIIPPKNSNAVDLVNKILSVYSGDQIKVACIYANKIIEPLKMLAKAVIKGVEK